MNQRLLLGSTALVSAGILFAGAAPVRAQGSTPITVTLSGYTEVGIHSGTDETLNPAPDQGYTGFMDTELHVQAQGTTSSGVTYGSYVAIDLYQPEDADETSNVHTDEAKLFFSGGFGLVELGRDDGVEDVMFVGAEDAQSGTGGIDGDGRNLPSVYHLSFGDAAKAIYFTPRIGGFQFGVNVTPDQDDDGGLDSNGFTNAAAIGANWVGAFSGLDLTLSAVGHFAKNAGNAPDPQRPISKTTFHESDDDEEDWSVGGLIGAGGLSFGVTAGQNTNFNQGNFANAGLKYKFGAASASVGYSWWEPDHGKTQNFYVVSADFGLLPGVTLKGDASYNTEDPGKDDSNGLNPGDTWSGVVSVQLDY